MENKFFKRFLETGLFDIGDQDERLDHLEKSIADLQKDLSGSFSKLPQYTLVALDPNISDNEPVLLETEAIVTEHWKTLRIKHTEMPRQILRGVILNALYELGVSSPLAARIIYLTGSNFYPFAKLNREKEIVKSLLDELSELAEDHAIEEWSLIDEEPSLKLGALKITDLSFGEVTISKSKLKEAFTASMQNSSSGHNTQHGGTSSWGDHFASTASDGIAKAFQSALNNLNKSLSPEAIENPINKFFASFKKTLDQTLKASFSSMVAVERRSKLLWWKETLYSQSLKRSYRGLDEQHLPVIMSSDLYQQLPAITPVSVDFLLKDTLYLLLGKEEEQTKFSDYLESIKRAESKSSLKHYFENTNDSEGRISITDFIGLYVNGKVKAEEFQNKTGIAAKETTTLSTLSVAILHDLMVGHLTSK